MATKVQRKSLWHMINHGGEALIFTGKKSTDWRVSKFNVAVIYGSANLLWGLKSNGWIENHPTQHEAQYGQSAYRITPKGIKAAGKKEPTMVATHCGNHGIRWK